MPVKKKNEVIFLFVFLFGFSLWNSAAGFVHRHAALIAHLRDKRTATHDWTLGWKKQTNEQPPIRENGDSDTPKTFVLCEIPGMKIGGINFAPLC